MGWDVGAAMAQQKGQVAATAREREDSSVSLFQLFLPSSWSRADSRKWPMLLFLHGAGDGDFAVMNSQSLPRLLSRDQSTAFDRRKVWTLKFGGAKYANATFAADCGFVVVMPQGWGARDRPGWSRARLDRVHALALAVAGAYGVDADRISLAGQSAGGVGAYAFAMQHAQLIASLVVICGALPVHAEVAAPKLAKVPTWIFHSADDAAMPVEVADAAVAALNADARRPAKVRYTRYDRAPAPPDPKYRDMVGHASYDLAFRDPRLYEWLRRQSKLSNMIGNSIRNKRLDSVQARAQARAASSADTAQAHAQARTASFMGVGLREKKSPRQQDDGEEDQQPTDDDDFDDDAASVIPARRGRPRRRRSGAHRMNWGNTHPAPGSVDAEPPSPP